MPITSWFSEQNDTELKELVPILIDMTKIDNVVTILGEPDNYSQTSPIIGTQSLNAALNPNVPKVQ